MKISFTPMRRDPGMALSCDGDRLTVNGETFDFSSLAEGATLSRDALEPDWLASDVRRRDGVVELTVILPHGPTAPEETLFPAPVVVETGPVPLPPYSG